MFKFFTHKKVTIKAPISGIVSELSEVPDDVFAQKIVGDGIAINPTDNTLYSPVKGKIVQIFPTLHALGIETEEGLEILIHLGVDTVELKGEGFTSFVEKDQQVDVGDKLIEIDWNSIKHKVPSIMTPILITNMDKVDKIEILKSGEIKAKEDLLSVTIERA
ncbi:PTS sugar transporter subunit IIA [Sporanaerobacter acetigenes]|uniref:PTS system IIA component, Glc family (TC 4.A.1) n=1 Tax=Sporanaerobacter acetigenes DSM 13106 TaxID=1123281 RepID=A0A1M5T2H4_9FIRM|nr:PTS glucose transporter subunit IIA [Sporanaerobacter acetigenes]SHH44959.1 PTS system IIA component, Glc family (TC 4.A.1) [Sporanaerobacter acetigenes DSM 13106]